MRSCERRACSRAHHTSSSACGARRRSGEPRAVAARGCRAEQEIGGAALAHVFRRCRQCYRKWRVRSRDNGVARRRRWWWQRQ